MSMHTFVPDPKRENEALWGDPGGYDALQETQRKQFETEFKKQLEGPKK